VYLTDWVAPKLATAPAGPSARWALDEKTGKCYDAAVAGDYRQGQVA